jgi:FO synthase
VNPEAQWPHIDRLRATCRAEGYDLAPRLPIYDEYIDESFVDAAMLRAIAARGEMADRTPAPGDEAVVQ